MHRVFDEGFRGQKRDQFELEKRKRQLGAARAICMRLDAKKAESRSEQESGEHWATTTRTTRDGRRSNRFWWIDDAMPDEVLGTKLMGPGAEVLVDLDQDQDKQTAEGRAFDHSDDEDGDLERNKAKCVRLDSSVPQGVDETDLQDEEPPKWGERPHFAQLEVCSFHVLFAQDRTNHSKPNVLTMLRVTLNRFTRSWKRSWRICGANIHTASGAPHNTMDQKIFQKIAPENPKTTIRLPLLYNKQVTIEPFVFLT